MLSNESKIVISPQLSESFTIPCRSCFGTGYVSEDWQKAMKVKIIHTLVKVCENCNGTKIRTVQMILNHNEISNCNNHKIEVLETPEIDNNFQGMMGCNYCGVRWLGRP